MAPDWEEVFGDVAGSLSKVHVSKFAGLSPKIEEDQVIFGRALGIQANGRSRLHDISISQVDRLSDDDSEGEDDDGKKISKRNKKWRTPMNGLELSIYARGKIYLRWLNKGKRLASFPLVTGKRQGYTELNCFLAHVNKRSFVSLMLRSRCGQTIRSSAQSRNRRAQGLRTELTSVTKLERVSRQRQQRTR